MADQFQPLIDSMESGLRLILNQVIDGTIEDLDGPIREVSLNLSKAARRRRMDLVDACKDQLALVILEKELRLRNDGMNFLENTLSVGINLLINGAIGGLSSIR